MFNCKIIPFVYREKLLKHLLVNTDTISISCQIPRQRVRPMTTFQERQLDAQRKISIPPADKPIRSGKKVFTFLLGRRQAVDSGRPMSRWLPPILTLRACSELSVMSILCLLNYPSNIYSLFIRTFSRILCTRLAGEILYDQEERLVRAFVKLFWSSPLHRELVKFSIQHWTDIKMKSTDLCNGRKCKVHESFQTSSNKKWHFWLLTSLILSKLAGKVWV